MFQGRCPGRREGHRVVGHWVAGSWDGAFEGLGLWYHFRGKALWKVRQHTPFSQTFASQAGRQTPFCFWAGLFFFL